MEGAETLCLKSTICRARPANLRFPIYDLQLNGRAGAQPEPGTAHEIVASETRLDRGANLQIADRKLQILPAYRIRKLLVGSALPRVISLITAARIPSTATARTMFSGEKRSVFGTGVASGVAAGVGGAFFAANRL